LSKNAKENRRLKSGGTVAADFVEEEEDLSEDLDYAVYVLERWL